MLKSLAMLSLTVLAVAAVAACSSSSSSSTNYDRGITMGPVGADLQGFYADWEQRVPMNGR